jgi:hypothetical protein
MGGARLRSPYSSPRPLRGSGPAGSKPSFLEVVAARMTGANRTAMLRETRTDRFCTIWDWETWAIGLIAARMQGGGYTRLLQTTTDQGPLKMGATLRELLHRTQRASQAG